MQHNASEDREIQPSMTVLKRIVGALFENGAIGRTRLSQAANLHYHVLSKYLKWMEKRKYIELIVENGRAVVRLTYEGRNFGTKLLSLYE